MRHNELKCGTVSKIRSRTLAVALRRTAGLHGPASLLASMLLLTSVSRVSAADLIVPAPEAPVGGVACEDPAVRSFPSVWLGHFAGGYSHYVGEGGPIVLDWRDEKLCFPDNLSCKRYIREMRRDFHRPEGYFTCLPIR